jgi:hypothetical protein
MIILPKFAQACGPTMPAQPVFRAYTPKLITGNWRLATRAATAAANEAAEFARTRFGLDLDDKQTQILTGEHYRLILCCTRQWGKSTVTAAKAVYHAYTRPKSLTLIISPSERQSREFLRRAKQFVEMLDIRPRSDGDNRISVQLPNGSRIVGVPGKEAHVRGFSAVSLLIIDEAAWVTEEQYDAVLPMLATTDGDIWMMSTPWGQRGFFWHEWTKGGPEWFKISVKATECARIKKNFLDYQRGRMSEAVFRREYLCEFMGTGHSVFRREDFELAVTNEIRSLWP